MKLPDFLSRRREKATELKTLPINSETARQLIDAMQEERLAEFARAHHLTPAHFSQSYSRFRTPLQYAVRLKQIDRIAEVLKPSGQGFTAKDFLTGNGIYPSPFTLASQCDNIAQLFIPSLWIGRIGEMEELAKKLSEHTRKEIDYVELRKEAVQLSVDLVSRKPAAFAQAQRGTTRAAEENAPQTQERA